MPPGTANGLLYEGPSLSGVRWAQTRRHEGSSPDPYGGFNLAPHVGEDTADTADNWRRLRRLCGVGRAEVATCRQVHGTRILRVDRGGHHHQEADALFSLSPGLYVGVFTADCVPVLYAAGGRGIAAAHCGWRGAAEGLAGETLAVLAKAARVPVTAIDVWLAPSIRQCSYEVGAEFRDRFAAAHLRPRIGGKYELDVAGVVTADLLDAGAAAHRIRVSTVDTFSDLTCYSYRREGSPAGRMLSFVGLADGTGLG